MEMLCPSSRNVYKAVEEIKKLSFIRGDPVTLRVENSN
jgi:hypothetical protein